MVVMVPCYIRLIGLKAYGGDRHETNPSEAGPEAAILLRSALMQKV
jgi:hypothetical protein